MGFLEKLFIISPAIEQTDKELLDEYKALCDKIIAEQWMGTSSANKYEELLKEIYKINLIPPIKLGPKNN